MRVARLSPRSAQYSAAIAWLTLAYLGVVAGLYVWQTLAVQVFLVLLSGVALIAYGRPLWRSRAVPSLALGVVPLGVTWALFGVGGIIAMRYPVDDRSSLMGVAYTDVAVLEMALMVGAASIAYVAAFTWSAGKSAKRVSADREVAWRQWAPGGLVVLLLVFDVYARVEALRLGTYFSWFMSEAAGEIRARSLIQHAQPVVAAFVLGLSVYLLKGARPDTVRTYRSRVFLMSVIIFEVAAAIATGSRQIVLKMAAVLVLGYLASGASMDPARRRRWLWVAAIGAITFFSWISPAIQEARFAMDRDRIWLSVPEHELPALFAARYLPAAMHPEVVWGERSLRREALNATLRDRLSSYAVYGASVRQRITDGMRPLGEKAFFDGFTTLLPRVLFPNKADMVGDEILLVQMGVGRRYLDRATDAGSTPTGNAYAHMRFFGLLMVMVTGGIAYGVATRLCVAHLGTVGVLLALAFLGSAVPEGDTFTAWLAGARNAYVLFGGVIIYRIVAHGVMSQDRRDRRSRPSLAWGGTSSAVVR